MWKGKGKEREVVVPTFFPRRTPWKRQDDDSGDADSSTNEAGVVLDLTFIGANAFDAAYTVPLKFGSGQQEAKLLVDTGSSDLWVASRSCSSSACSEPSSSKLFDSSSSSSAINTNVQFSIQYLVGEVSGPIYWDTVSIGPYAISGQAFAAAESVEDESLSDDNLGVLGLALPANSIIQSLIPASDGSSGDGATFGSNLFGIDEKPDAQFLGLTLHRPGSSRVPSVLSIGQHPDRSAYDLSNSSLVFGETDYSVPIASATGAPFWKSVVFGVTVWVDGQARPITLGMSTTGMGGRPTAVVDSGVPLLLVSRNVANAIYGALGVGPASDGQYYLPCTTPLNMTITLDTRPPIPLHPLDLTAPPADSKESNPSTCMGTVQAADLSASSADMVLGVPFLRNVYMVMAYQVPRDNGSFPELAVGGQYVPRLGLQALTDSEVAMNEFNTVRKEGKSLDSGGGGDSTGDGGGGGAVGRSGLRVGILALIGISCFFGLCLVLFGLRWLVVRRKLRREQGLGGDTAARDPGSPRGTGTAHQTVSSGIIPGMGWWRKRKRSQRRTTSLGEYELATRGERDALQREDDLRKQRYSAYLERKKMASEYTMSSGRTRVPSGDDWMGNWMGKKDAAGVEEHDRLADGDPDNDNSDDAATNENAPRENPAGEWDPATGLDWSGAPGTAAAAGEMVRPSTSRTREDVHSTSPERRPTMLHRYSGSGSRRGSNGSAGVPGSPELPRLPSTAPASAGPLVETVESPTSILALADALPGEPPKEGGLGSGSGPQDEELGSIGGGMAGIGTAARSGRVGSHFGSVDWTRTDPTSHPSAEPTTTSSPLIGPTVRLVPRERPNRTPSGPRTSTASMSSR